MSVPWQYWGPGEGEAIPVLPQALAAPPRMVCNNAQFLLAEADYPNTEHKGSTFSLPLKCGL